MKVSAPWAGLLAFGAVGVSALTSARNLTLSDSSLHKTTSNSFSSTATIHSVIPSSVTRTVSQNATDDDNECQSALPETTPVLAKSSSGSSVSGLRSSITTSGTSASSAGSQTSSTTTGSLCSKRRTNSSTVSTFNTGLATASSPRANQTATTSRESSRRTSESTSTASGSKLTTLSTRTGQSTTLSHATGPALSSSTGTASGSVSAAPISHPGQSSTHSSPTTEASTSSVKNGGVPPAGTLLPAVHWDHPIDDPRNLEPGKSGELYYSSHGISDSSREHKFAQLTTTFQHEVVFLLHSALINSVSCRGGAEEIVVTFTDFVSFNHAASSWSAKSEFVVATYAAGCGSDEEQHSFWLTSQIIANEASNSISVRIERQLLVGDVFDEVDLAWGTYSPSKSNPSSGSPGRGSSGAGTSGTGSSGNGPSGGFSGQGSAGQGSSTGSSGGGLDGSSGGNSGSKKVSNYDQQLDKALGYFDFSESDYRQEVAEFSPDVAFDDDSLVYEPNSFFDDEEDMSGSDDASKIKRSILAKRGFNPFKFIKKAAQKIGGTLVKAVKGVVKVVTNPKELLNLAKDLLTFNPSVGKSFPVDIGPKRNDPSPWDLQKKLFSKQGSTSDGKGQADAAIYCVRCGVKGNVDINGRASWSLIGGLKLLKAEVAADLTAGLNLGLVANAVYVHKEKKNLATFAVPKLGIAIKGIFSAGATVMVDAEATVRFDATGQALMGVELHWPKFIARAVAVGDEKSTVDGYTPNIKRVLEASGKISAEAKLALPISVGVGISIIPLKFDKGIRLIEEPSISGKIGFQGSVGGAQISNEPCNNGFSYTADLANEIKFDILGLKTIPLIEPKTVNILKGCKTIGSKISDRGEPDVFPRDDGTPSDEPSTTSEESSTASHEPSHTSDTPSASSDESTHTTNEPSTASEEASHTSDAASSTTDEPTSTSSGASEPTDDTTGSSETVNIFDEEDHDFVPDEATEVYEGEMGDDAANPNNPEFQFATNRGLELAHDAVDDEEVDFRWEIANTDSSIQFITDPQGALVAAKGGIGANNGSGLFGVFDGVAAIDYEGRILHYYPQEMAAFRASRLLFAEVDETARTSEVIGLKPLHSDDAGAPPSDILFAVDGDGDAYHLALCSYAQSSSPSRIFLVDGDAGLDALTRDESAQRRLLGDLSAGCESIALKLVQAEAQ